MGGGAKWNGHNRSKKETAQHYIQTPVGVFAQSPSLRPALSPCPSPCPKASPEASRPAQQRGPHSPALS